MKRNLPTIAVDLPPQRPDVREWALIVAIVQRTYTDACGACPPPNRWTCQRADAIDACHGVHLLDLAALVDLGHAVEAIGRLPRCCNRIAPQERPPRAQRAAESDAVAERRAMDRARRRRAA